MKLRSRRQYIETEAGKMKIIVLFPDNQSEKLPGILWIHGGGYTMGMAEMVYASCGRMLAKKFGAVVVAPDYRLAPENQYPAALEDCYAALKYMHDNMDALGIDRLIVGGESAGGGLTAALCIYARDKGEISIDMQIPLYPMLDCFDTESSKDNHGKVWNTARNHRGWKKYLGELSGKQDIPPYASPARETNYTDLPPCYTFVCDGEPFCRETVTYVRKLQEAGIKAAVDVYHGDLHSFDLLTPWTAKARKARKILCDKYREIIYNTPAGGSL